MTPDDRQVVETIARDVMGWAIHYDSKRIDSWVYPKVKPGVAPLPSDAVYLGPTDMTNCWNPLTSWADAGMVAEALAQRKVMVRVYLCEDGASCRFDDRPISEGATGPRAISLAAYQWSLAQKGKE